MRSTPPRRLPPRPFVLVVLGAVFAGCAPGAPQQVGLADLVADADQYDGDTVQTTGTVREFTENEALERHFVIEDADDNRVELVPHEVVEGHADQPVRVTGRFTYDPEVGRAIDVDDIEPIPADA